MPRVVRITLAITARRSSTPTLQRGSCSFSPPTTTWASFPGMFGPGPVASPALATGTHWK
ncbi:unnamed protein product [Polarella glacialis]|uniref:Uncharacterized protein n=1 Tax=Polarella glacialis TaxID=89957 RepID=A0A813LRI7_POLGL|nr:unnamed protein product [Polarella glacialis]